jgi:hypothetical protein
MFVPAAFAELETETSVGERAHFLGGIGFLHVTGCWCRGLIGRCNDR